MENCDKIIFRYDDVAIKVGIVDSNESPIDPGAGIYKLVFFTAPNDRLIVTHNADGFSSNKPKVVSKCDIIDGKVVVYINKIYFTEGELMMYITNAAVNDHFDDGFQDVSGCTAHTGYFIKEK